MYYNSFTDKTYYLQLTSLSHIEFKMFSIWIKFLLKFFDISGFHTETSIAKRKGPLINFTIHVIWASTLTIFLLSVSRQPIILTEALAYSANYLLQNVNGMFTYWVIILESFVQRKNQQKFWKIFKQIDEYRKIGGLMLRKYSIKFIHFFGVITIIQTYFVLYFLHVNGNHFIFFRIAYFCFVAMYQCRAFYYLFYLELIKCELKKIKNKLEDMVTGSWRIRNDYRIEKSVKNLNRLYRQIYALSVLINEIFGWSNFTTVIYCFHLPTTDFNWALQAMYKQTDEYFIGNQKSLHLFCLENHQIFLNFFFSIYRLVDTSLLDNTLHF